MASTSDRSTVRVADQIASIAGGTTGGGAPAGVTGPATPDSAPWPPALTARMRNRYATPSVRPVTV